ncbi:MAG: hypothetical protein E2603_07340 [Achromobacter sp.]|nr:hypothetical protein [Achromobacter sp.]
MTSYYLLQHVLLALGLALCAGTGARWFHVGMAPRMLLAVALTPQIIGLSVMALAMLGVSAPGVYAHLPTALGLGLIGLSGRGGAVYRRIGRAVSQVNFCTVIIACAAVLVLVQLIFIIAENSLTLNPLAHDFNVYLTGAKKFAAMPSMEAMPSFFGKVGDIIVVHPHSFIYEAYLSHALLLAGPDTAFPPLDFLPRLGQQLTILYLCVALFGAALAMGARWGAVAAVCLALYIPWVSYIVGALSRDGFRMVPVLSYLVMLGSLCVNARSAMLRRGLLAGSTAALAIMSHTLGLMLIGLTSFFILGYAAIRNRPRWKAAARFVLPMFFLGALSTLRYVEYYRETGNFMGYGLQYSIYRGTWLEPLLAVAWTNNVVSGWEALDILWNRYDWHLQLAALVIGLLVVLFAKGRGRITYRCIGLALCGPLLIALSGLIDHTGINLRNALIANERYALSYFLLSALLVGAGLPLLGRTLAARFPVAEKWRQWAAVLVTVFAAWLAHESLLSLRWLSYKPFAEDVAQIDYLKRMVNCLSPQGNWLVDDDGWNPYFANRPPAFVYTQPVRPLLLADSVDAVRDVLKAMRIQAVAFVYSPDIWKTSPLYKVLEQGWVRVPMKGSRDREVWLAPGVAACIN